MKKILIIDTYYNGMLKHIQDSPEKYTSAQSPDYLEIFKKGFFGNGASYAYYLSSFGYETKLLVANYIPENFYLNTKKNKKSIFWTTAYHQSRIPFLNNFLTLTSSVHKKIYNEILNYNPDYVLVHDINLFPKSFAYEIKKLNIKLIGEISSPLPPSSFFTHFDLVVSSLLPIVAKLQSLAVNAKFLPLGFDPRILKSIDNTNKEFDVVFVGSFSKYHSKNIPLLHAMAGIVDNFKIFGVDKHDSIAKNGLKKYYAGAAWGLDMFQILNKSKIVINRHIDMAGNYAANMRLFETTGVGSLLLTDRKKNLNEYFDVGNEVIDYEDFDDAAQKVKFLLQNPAITKNVASAGQIRTLKDHTYEKRAEVLANYISKLN